MTEENKSRRQFENIVSEEEPEEEPREIRKAPFEMIEIGLERNPSVIHGNIFDHEPPPLTPEQGQMALKRLEDEGFSFDE
jgi:hypothetical protein